jgi:hypothetical protein
LPLLVPQIDVAAHAGGLAFGLGVTLLALGRQGGLEPDAPWRRRLALPAVALVALTAVGLGAAAWHARRARPDEQLRVIDAFARSRAATVDALNLIAWTFATDPKAGPAELRVARAAAARALGKDPSSVEVQDTLATVDYRLGDFDRAIAEERAIVDGAHADGVYATQLARFLEARLKQSGPPPQAAALRFSSEAAELDHAPPEGLVVYALVYVDGKRAGLARLRLAPGERRVPLAAPQPSRLEVALVDEKWDGASDSKLWPTDERIAEFP